MGSQCGAMCTWNGPVTRPQLAVEVGNPQTQGAQGSRKWGA